MKKEHFYALFRPAFLLLTVLISLGASWILLAQVNFAYPWLHDHAGIAENIEYYSSRNLVKPDFKQTTREERIRLFAGIVLSIHHQGQGLEALAYHTKKGIQRSLLTQAEIVHLQDVAHLYARIKSIIQLAFFLWLGLLVIQFKQRSDLLKTRMQFKYALVLAVITVIVVLAVLAIGAKKIFYKLHEVVFPAGHQWFFYYEESLMSMMMKAPDMFAYIAVMLVIMTLIITVSLFKLVKYFSMTQS